MPPKKKKARVQSKNDQELEKVVKWLSRDSLEGLVLAAARGESISAEDLWRCAPERAAIEIRKNDAPLVGGSDRVGTGLFDELDATIMREIFSYCGLLDKIKCVTSVCKAWRAYKTLPALFSDVSEHLVASRTASIFNRASFTNALLDFVPDETVLEAIRISTSKSDDHNYLNAIFKRLAAAKDDAEEKGQVYHLKKLVLQGEKLSPTVMKRLAASGICSSLTSLVFHDVYGSKKLYKEDAIPNLLRSCPSLEEFVAPQALFVERNVSIHVSALSAARGGAPPLLKVLDLSDRAGWGGDRAIEWSILSKLGTHLPFLEVLKIYQITYDTPAQSDPSAPDFVAATPPISQFLSEPFAPIPNLKVFEVSRLISRFDFRNELTPRYVTTPYLTKILTRLMDAAPALESLSFGHGKHSNPTKKKLRQGKLIVPPLPTFEVGMLPIPSTLTNLSLEYIAVEPNEFMGLDVRRFDSIQFKNCGPAMTETIQMLHQQAPIFKLNISENGDAVEMTRPGYML